MILNVFLSSVEVTGRSDIIISTKDGNNEKKTTKISSNILKFMKMTELAYKLKFTEEAKPLKSIDLSFKISQKEHKENNFKLETIYLLNLMKYY